MMIKFTKNIICIHSGVCADAIRELVEEKIGISLEAPDVNSMIGGHISIHHEANNHTVWVFVYDTDGVHESESEQEEIVKPNVTYLRKRQNPNNAVEELGTLKVIVTQNNSRVKRPTIIPNTAQENQVRAITPRNISDRYDTIKILPRYANIRDAL